MQRDEHDAPGERPLLFLSYSRGDLAHARPVMALLETNGFDVWWDGRLEGGENYLQTTETALESAGCVVVLWSATSVNSHWVRDEAQRGRERGCLVPLTIDGTMAPLGFRQVQLLDISGWDGSPASPEAARILVAVRAKLAGGTPGLAQPAAGALSTPAAGALSTPAAGALSTPAAGALSSPAAGAPSAPSSPPLAPAPAPAFALSRRALMIGGAGAVGAAGVLGAWQFGMFGSAASAAEISMVVLPFANQTGDPEKKYFSDGLARELRSVLARNPRLKVAAPASTTAIEGEDDFAIGRKLGVGHILRGSVQRDTERLRITTELVAIDGGEMLWGEVYDRALADVFAVQSEIARSVAVSLVARIAGAGAAEQGAAAQDDIGGTQNVAAYEAFLRGHALYDLGGGDDTQRAALEQFDAAIAADPDYAAAHAMRANMLASIANNAASDGPESRALFTAAKAAAERALALEKRLARGHLAMGFVLNNGWLRPGEAAPHYRAAQDLAPGDADVLRSVASFHAYGADQALAMEMIAKVLELDPLNARAFRSAGFAALFARDYPAVVAHMQQGLALNPSLASAQFGIAVARLMQDDPKGAIAAAEAEKGEAYALTVKAIAAHRLGDAAGADAAQAALVTRYPDTLYQRAEVEAQRGRPQEALALLETAYEKLDPGMLWTRNDPLLDPLRSEPRFKDLLSRLGS